MAVRVTQEMVDTAYMPFEEWLVYANKANIGKTEKSLREAWDQLRNERVRSLNKKEENNMDYEALRKLNYKLDTDPTRNGKVGVVSPNFKKLGEVKKDGVPSKKN